MQSDTWIALLVLGPSAVTAVATATLATIESKRRKNQQSKNLQMHADALILWDVYVDVLLNINSRNIACLDLVLKGIKNRYRNINSLSLHKYPTYLSNITQDTGLLNYEVRMQCERIKGGVHFGNTKIIDTNSDFEAFLPLTQDDTWAVLVQSALSNEAGNDPFGYAQHLRHTIDSFKAYKKTLIQFHDELTLVKLYICLHKECLESTVKKYERQDGFEIQKFKFKKVLKSVIFYQVDEEGSRYKELLKIIEKTYSWK